MAEEKKLGLRSVISVSVGLVIATSCLVSLGQGAGTIGVIFIVAMVIACLLNMTTIASLSELNALMPNTTGGLAQYTLASMGPFPTLISMVGGYLLCNVLSSGVEASIFAYAMEQTFHLPIPRLAYTIIMTIILLIANLRGVDMFAKIQDLVAYLLVGSMVLMGIIGALGLGTGKMVHQPMCMATNFSSVVSMTAVAFWLFIGAEYAIPISKEVKNAKKNVPLGMMLGLIIICVVQSVLVLGFHNYTDWKQLADSAAPHLLYGVNLLGQPGKIWMAFVAALAVISNGSTDAISFMILVGSVFWMISYILAHVDVLILRRRLPKAPRSFKSPGGGLLQIIGILETVYMVLNISTDPAERNAIWLITIVVFAILAVYAFFWIRYKMKIPVFKSVPLEKVMAMENSMYYVVRRRRGLCK